METTIGGDRLGSGAKQTVSFRNYERSTHDLGYVWRSSMAAGTLVPFMSKVALPGDKWYINLNCDVLTLPTIGPLFGSYKVQLDVFEIPIRLYNAKLHMNRLGIGMDMKSILLPQIQLYAENLILSNKPTEYRDNEQINASCILKYLGISGLGAYRSSAPAPVRRWFNAVPYLAYWDVYKNYYASKQEEIGLMIHTTKARIDDAQTPIKAEIWKNDWSYQGSCMSPSSQTIELDYTVFIHYKQGAVEPDPAQLAIEWDGVRTNIQSKFSAFYWDDTNKILEASLAQAVGEIEVLAEPDPSSQHPKYYFGLQTFPLETIDHMRDSILQYAGTAAFELNSTSPLPYGGPMEQIESHYACTHSQEGLGVKTYQSDLFNNWIQTEWIDGTGGISELTAVDTSDGNFTIDALNIASKVYDMLNRIAISGGTYDDWLEAVYTHERVKGVESPVYCGSLIKELAFEEVVSTAESYNDKTKQKQPLGTLAGRGRLTGKNKGGHIEITVNEPSYIMGIVSLTPRIDYSQGNEFDVNLKTMDDFHKPALDGIGFQDLISDQMLWSDTEIGTGLELTKYSLGKQPAWINYMTSVNKTYGAFAEPDNSMFMTLNRKYEKYHNGTIGGRLRDATTYIDPSKFNNVWAESALAAQNFWVQINVDAIARRKMSAKIIPNL